MSISPEVLPPAEDTEAAKPSSLLLEQGCGCIVLLAVLVIAGAVYYDNTFSLRPELEALEESRRARPEARGAPQAQAPQGIRAEVIEYVARPCAEVSVRRELLKLGATVEEQEALFDLGVLVVLQAHEIQESIDAVVPIAVKMPSRAARLAFYELSKQICIDSRR